MAGKGRSARGRLLEFLEGASFDKAGEAIASSGRVDLPGSPATSAATTDGETTVDAGRGTENSVAEHEDGPVLASEERDGAKSYINNSDSDMQLHPATMEQQLANLPAAAAHGPRTGSQKYPTRVEQPEITFELNARAPNTDSYHSTDLAITDTAQLSKIVHELGWSSVTAVVQRGTRFTSSNYSGHHSVESIAIPPEEKHIYASIEVLKDRIDRLQRHNTDLQQRGEEQDNELVALRNQLRAYDRRPDSGFGAPEVDLEELREQKLQYEALLRTFNALADRNTAKRRTLEEALNKVTGERTDYQQQLARALSEIEELKQSKTYLLEQNNELRVQIENHVCNNSTDDAHNMRRKLAERITSYEYVAPENQHTDAGHNVAASTYSIDFEGGPSDFTENLEYYMKGTGTKGRRPEESNPMTQSRPSQGVSSAGDWPSASKDLKPSTQSTPSHGVSPAGDWDSESMELRPTSQFRPSYGVSPAGNWASESMDLRPTSQFRPSQGVSSAGDWPSVALDHSAVLPEHSPAVLPHSMKAKVNGRFVRTAKYGYNVKDDEIHTQKTRGPQQSEPAKNTTQDENRLRYGSRTISSADWSDLDLRHNSAPRPPKHLRKWENWPKGIMDRISARPLPTTYLTTDEEHESLDKDSKRKKSTSTDDAEGWTSFSDGRSMSNGMDKVAENISNKQKPTQQENHSENLTGLSQALRDISNSEVVRSKLEEERKASREVDGASTKSPQQDFQTRKPSLKKVTIVSPPSSDEAEPQMASGSYHSAKGNGTATDKSSGTQFHSFSGQKSLRDYQNTSEQESLEPSQKTPSASSVHSKSKRYERKASAKDGETSAFIVPDITLETNRIGLDAGIHTGFNPLTGEPIDPKTGGPLDPKTGAPINPFLTVRPRVASWVNKQDSKEYYDHDEEGDDDADSAPPIPVTERSQVEDEDADIDIPDLDISCATIRPSQPPPKALAMVIKQIEDEVEHLKTQLSNYAIAYARHDPSVGRRRRVALKQSMERYEAEIEKRSEQVYALYDVLEGQQGQKF